MSGSRSPKAVVAGFDARPGEATEALFDLVRQLKGAGIAPQVLLVGDGERLAELRTLAPVTVTNDFRWRGAAILTSLARAERWTRGLKGRHLRRWLRRRSGLPWIVQHPAAASILRHAQAPSATVVLALPSGTVLDDLADRDRAALRGAQLCLASDEHQAASLAALEPETTLVLEDLDVADHRTADPGDPARWPVLLVPTPDAWDAINHTDEVAHHLHRHHPEVPVVWLVSEGQDRWLAQHDLAARGLTDAISLATHDEVKDILLRAVVRTGYGPAHQDLLAHARAAGVGTLELASAGDPVGPGVVPPLAVDDLLAQLDRMLADTSALDTARRQLDEQRARAEAAVALRTQLAELLGP